MNMVCRECEDEGKVHLPPTRGRGKVDACMSCTRAAETEYRRVLEARRVANALASAKQVEAA